MSEKSINKQIGTKIQKIMHEGVRKNTHKPVSSANPRRKVSFDQAKAIAEHMVRKGKS